MKKSLWINASLLAAVVLLGLVAWLKPTAGEPAHAISTLKAGQVKTLEVAIAGAPQLTIKRSATDWAITAPFTARADNFQVQRLLELLDAKSSERLPATGLARYGLNEPATRVTIDGQLFAFGAVNEMSREQYVLSGDGVYLLALRYGAALPKNVLSMVSKQLFTADEAPVSFDFGAFQVEQTDGKTTLKWLKKTGHAAEQEAGPDEINRWIDDWRLANALAVQAIAGGNATGELKVRLKTGRDVIIRILERGANTVISRSDQPFAYVLSTESAARLLSPPGAGKSVPAPAAETATQAK